MTLSNDLNNSFGQFMNREKHFTVTLDFHKSTITSCIKLKFMRNITSKRDSIFQLENLQSMPVKTEKKRFKCSVCDKSFILRKKKVPILDPFMRENSQTCIGNIKENHESTKNIIYYFF